MKISLSLSIFLFINLSFGIVFSQDDVAELHVEEAINTLKTDTIADIKGLIYRINDEKKELLNTVEYEFNKKEIKEIKRRARKAKKELKKLKKEYILLCEQNDQISNKSIQNNLNIQKTRISNKNMAIIDASKECYTKATNILTSWSFWSTNLIEDKLK